LRQVLLERRRKRRETGKLDTKHDQNNREKKGTGNGEKKLLHVSTAA
jgi:hypothetical protein